MRDLPRSDRWTWLGGTPALDFVNTLRAHPRGAGETLAEPADLAAWLRAAALTERELRVPRGVLGEARDLRAAIDAAVVAAAEARPVPAADVGLIDDWLVHAGARPELRLQGGVPVLGERAPADSARRALGMVALDAARLLGDAAARARLRVCAADGCATRFLDRSPAAARRWCSMTTCGNAAKARRHRARVAGAAA